MIQELFALIHQSNNYQEYKDASENERRLFDIYSFASKYDVSHIATLIKEHNILHLLHLLDHDTQKIKTRINFVL